MSDTQRNLSTVQSIYQAFGGGDVPTILNALRDDVIWEIGAHDHGIPWLTPGQGKERVMAFFGAVAGFQFERFEVKNLLIGGDQVVALIDIAARTRPTAT